jgi:hypothetical protein
MHRTSNRIHQRGAAGGTRESNRSGIDHGGPGGQDIASSAHTDESGVAIEGIDGIEWDRLRRPLQIESVLSRKFRQVDLEAVVTVGGLGYRK